MTGGVLSHGYLRQLFDGYAPRFEAHLQARLGYRVPQVMREAWSRVAASSTRSVLVHSDEHIEEEHSEEYVEKHSQKHGDRGNAIDNNGGRSRRIGGGVTGGGAVPRPPLDILDLGSGTGLVGQAFRDITGAGVGGYLCGVDLSPVMHTMAARKEGVYDELKTAAVMDVLLDRTGGGGRGGKRGRGGRGLSREGERSRGETGRRKAEENEQHFGRMEGGITASSAASEEAEAIQATPTCGAEEGGDSSARDHAWDLITAADLLPYIEDLGAFLEGCLRALRPGGIVMFSTESGDEGSTSTTSTSSSGAAGREAAGGEVHGPLGILDPRKLRFAHSRAMVRAQLRRMACTNRSGSGIRSDSSDSTNSTDSSDDDDSSTRSDSSTGSQGAQPEEGQEHSPTAPHRSPGSHSSRPCFHLVEEQDIVVRAPAVHGVLFVLQRGMA